ncbi:class I SAM-dependent methyltransferase [Nonlabens ponticola]|uniref:Class I SAM-dependent methyltransferase n=1 Tax=Nonlabens ponticola TaxID=2496866 RepID=A0A3S9N0C5_9FLAO|nr:class I SAM-dependent methyltransferase [Nonlabens ponticola]AZQ44772.1 class I SAM-dependent methyltransferase [Nonlabens ponticola]
MKYFKYIFSLIFLSFSLTSCKGQTQTTDSTRSDEQTESSQDYVYKSGSINGIGKWYMGREIAHVMGFQGMEWLERPEREQEENTSILLENMNIQPDDNIADIGAGSGYHVFKMAPQVPEGKIYAVDIQPEMLAAMNYKKEESNIENVELILGSEKSVNLPSNSVDKILMVDVYHEFSFPVAMIASMRKALKKDGEIYLIEYRGEDPQIPIKTIHKMSEAQAVKEFNANGFKLKENIDHLPWQHCMVFVKK